jgi:hypothetical protein
VSGILPARFPGELRDRLREIEIDLMRATARASDGPAGNPETTAGRHWIRLATYIASEARSSRCLKSDPSNEQIAQVLGLWGGTTKVHHLLTNWRM